MSTVAAIDFLTLSVWLTVGSLGAAFVHAAFFGRLNLHGLLTDKATGRFSLARLQLVATTIVVCLIYLRSVATADTAAGVLPELDSALLAALASGSLYGIAKLNSTLKANTNLSLLENLLTRRSTS